MGLFELFFPSSNNTYTAVYHTGQAVYKVGTVFYSAASVWHDLKGRTFTEGTVIYICCVESQERIATCTYIGGKLTKSDS